MLRPKSLAPIALIAFWVSVLGPAAAQSQPRASSEHALTPLDYYEIEQLYARYCHAYDSAADNGYMYADLYTPDGAFINQAGVVRQGREQLAEVARGGAGARKGPTVMTHFVSNVAIEPAPGGATGKGYLLIAGPPHPGEGLRATIVNGGQYWDEFVKTADGWRIKKRTYHQAHPPAPGSSSAPASSSTPPASTGARHAEHAVGKIELTAADYAEIYQLYGRYSYAFDGGLDSGNAWAELFTPDGFHSNASNNEWVKGPVALADFARGAMRFERGFTLLTRMDGTIKDPTRIAHIITNIMLEPTSEGVVAKAYRMMAGNGANGQPNAFLTGGMYFDLLVKTPQGWLYKEKFYMGTDHVPDLATRFIVPATSAASAPSASATASNPPPPAAAPRAAFTPEEFAEIQQLYARSIQALDNAADNGGAYARWFTADGTFTDAGGTVAAGRDRIAQVARANPNSGRTPITVQTFLYNLKVERSPEGATGSAYAVIGTINEPGKPITMNDGGQFHDVLVKTTEGWRIKMRRFVRAAPGGLAAPSKPARSQWSPS